MQPHAQDVRGKPARLAAQAQRAETRSEDAGEAAGGQHGAVEEQESLKGLRHALPPPYRRDFQCTAIIAIIKIIKMYAFRRVFDQRAVHPQNRHSEFGDIAIFEIAVFEMPLLQAEML